MGVGRERERGGRKTSHGKPAMAVLRGLDSGCQPVLGGCWAGGGEGISLLLAVEWLPMQVLIISFI